MSLGKLTITLIEAKFTRDVDLIRKMDPYVKFKSREQVFKSGVDKKGGKHPKWESDNVFEIDVKYLGDDITFVAKDDDRGKDEKIGDGESKISAFCCQPEWDEWFEVEHKGRRAGKIHIASKWEPVNEESHNHDDMGEIQQAIRELAMKKKELTEAFNDIKDLQDKHKEEGEARVAEAEAAAAGEDWDAKAAEAEAKCVADHEAAQAMRDEAEGNKEEFEKSIAEQLKIAIETRDAVVNGMEGNVAAADEEKEAAIAAAEAEKVACEEKNAEEKARVEGEIEEEKRGDAIREEAIKDEIKETAEKLLAINQQIQDYLTKLTEL